MALIKCHECGSNVSSEAASCPKCGATPRLPDPPNWKARIIFALASIALLVGYVQYSDWSEKRARKRAEVDEFMRREHLTSEQRVAEDNAKKAAEIEAKKMADEKARQEKNYSIVAGGESVCEGAIKAMLRDPATAQITTDHWSIESEQEGIYWLTSIVRARNGFNGMTIGSWQCKFRHKDGKSEALDLKPLQS